MQLISLAQASQLARKVLARFPGTMIAAVAAAGFALAMIHRGGEQPTLVRALLAATLGLPLGVAFETTSERRRWSDGKRWGIRLAIAAALFVLFWLSRGWTTMMLTIRYIQFSVVFHLLVAVWPFAGGATERGFWQFNRTLLQRFLIATFYTGVLFVTLALALAAIDQLLGIEVESKAYLQLAALLGFVFQPWFFLGGLPLDLDVLETSDDYPGAMKVFAQFILMPVVTLYLLILTIYLGRVVVTRTWPSGWIGYLVTGVAVAGTFVLLLVHPIRERADSRWVNVFGRWFYVALLPSIGMLLLAIDQRVRQYGVTESRYFLAVIASWLAGIAIYYSLSRSHRIRWIPLSLGLVALATLVGPWSATAIARRSQVGRLRTLLLRNDLLADGKLQRSAVQPPPADQREIRAVLDYLVKTHGTAALARVSVDLREIAAASAEKSPIEALVDTLGLQESIPTPPVWSEARRAVLCPVTGYDYVVHTDLVQAFTVPVGNDTLAFTYSNAPPVLHVTRRGGALLDLDLGPLLQMASARPPGAGKAAQPVAEPPLYSLEARGNGLHLGLCITSLHWARNQDAMELQAASGHVLIDVDDEVR